MTKTKTEQWYILYTLSRHEKKIESYLRKKGIESYLPVYTSVRQWSDRKRKLTLPLFPNYLFVKTNSKNFWKILNISGTVKFIGNGKSPVPVPFSLICDIQKVTTGKFELKENLTVKGTEVRLIKGPFEGMKGKFVRYMNCLLYTSPSPRD